MEAKLTVPFILSLLYSVKMSTEDESCFIETEVKAKAHCRVGISECNTVALKRNFPHLFNQTYNSDYPQGVTVTAFCEANDGDSTSYPGLQYQFRPPGHHGVTSIRGFEVRLEGGPASLSDFQCVIIELDNNLTLEQISVTFSSRFYPVARRTPYVVVFSSLPKKDHSYRYEKHIRSKSCDTHETSADWQPGFCNITYDSDSETLHVIFEAPPEKFKFDQFKVILTDRQKYKHTHSNVNQTEFSIPDFKAGEYEIRIEPFNPNQSNEKLCKCRNTDGRCDSCTEFIKRFDAVVSAAPTTMTLKEADHTLPTVLIPVLCAILFIGAIFAVIFLRRHGKLRLHKATVEAHGESKPNIEIIYEDKSLNERHIAEKLRNIVSIIFSNKIEMEVTGIQNKRDKNDLRIYVTEPESSRSRSLNSKHLKDAIEQIHEDSQRETLLEKSVLITYNTGAEQENSKVIHFNLMNELPNLITYINSLVHLNEESIDREVETNEYKAAVEELDVFINDLKQVPMSNDTRLFVELPTVSAACHGETLHPSRCLSNTNSEPDSGIRSGDEFESLNSSEETMNDNIPNYGRHENWLRSCNSQGFGTNSAYAFTNSPYDDEQETSLNWNSTKPMIEAKDPFAPQVPRCPSEIQFICPEPSEYSEYGEDVFFDEANNVPSVQLNHHMLFTPHKTQSSNYVPNSVAYHRNVPNNQQHRPTLAQHRGKNKPECKNSKQLHSSMESLMDKMADVNARYQCSLENERETEPEGVCKGGSGVT